MLGIESKNSPHNKPGILKYFLVLSLLLIILSAGLYTLWRIPDDNLQPLASLPVPEVSGVYFTEPLTLAPLSDVILGAQTIDPDDIIKYVNIEREKTGSPPLKISPVLKKAAQDRARVILQYQNFSHQDPFEGIELATILPQKNYYFAYASENIGMGGVSAQDFVGGFMNSTSHRENLLNPELQESGVAVVTGPYKEYYVNIAVQIFAVPASRDKFLGYTPKDIQLYKNLLVKIGADLENTNYKIGQNLANRNFYQDWQNLLSEQKQIVKTIYNQMLTGKPFNNIQINLISLYNQNWKKAIN